MKALAALAEDLSLLLSIHNQGTQNCLYLQLQGDRISSCTHMTMYKYTSIKREINIFKRFTDIGVLPVHHVHAVLDLKGVSGRLKLELQVV